MNRSDSDRGRSPPAAVAQRRGRGWFSRGAGAGHTLRPGTGRGPLLRPGQLTGNGWFMERPLSLRACIGPWTCLGRGISTESRLQAARTG